MGTMTDGHRRREEDDGRRIGVGGPWRCFKLQQPVRGDTQLLSETWGCERRCDVDLGSSHDDGWSRSRYQSLIGQMEGVIQLPFFPYGPCRSQKKNSELQKRHACYADDVMVLAV